MKRLSILLAFVCSTTIVLAQAPPPPRAASSEAATARRFAALKSDPLRLSAFLREMPKGGDLHNHLSGAIYAESYLRWAAEDKLCVVTATMAITVGTCDAAAGRPAAADVLANSALYSQAIDAMSMRNWNPATNGHDHFFATFGKFGVSSTKTGDMLAEVMARAAAEHVSYLELMVTTTGATAAAVARATGWDPDLPRLRDKMLATGLRDQLSAEAKTRIDAAEARMRDVLTCASTPAPGCGVTVRYIGQVSRAAAPEIVFAQMLIGFELPGIEPRVVSLNLVQPEDDPNAVANFALQMRMLDYLHGQYPRVPITLHAGELVEGLVAPETLRTHIRQSIETGHASRIGHGVAVMDEDDPYGLLRDMAAKKVLVEIALTSNDVILGVRGKQHPLKTYLAHGVPVAIVTDDPGVSRSTHTEEFVKAVREHDLDYPTLKRMARNSIAFSFADEATKKRLLAAFDRDSQAFERGTSSPKPPAPSPSSSSRRD